MTARVFTITPKEPPEATPAQQGRATTLTDFVWGQTRHQRFHEALVATCRAPVLQQLRRQLFDISSCYRNLTRAISSRDDLEEHRALMDACLARDAGRARRLISDHFELTGNLVLATFDQQRKAQDARRKTNKTCRS